MSFLDSTEEKQTKNTERETKERILKKMQFSDFETLCLRLGVKNLHIKQKDKRYVDKYTNYLVDKLELNDLIEYAKEQKIDITEELSDYHKKIEIIKENFEEDYYPNTGNSEFEGILSKILMKFSPEMPKNDEELQVQLVQFLKDEYKSKEVQVNIETNEGRISIIFDNEYGLRPVVADTREKLRLLVGEIKDYLKVCRDAAVIAISVDYFSSEEIDEYAKEITEIGGYFVLIGQYIKQKKIEVQI